MDRSADRQTHTVKYGGHGFTGGHVQGKEGKRGSNWLAVPIVGKQHRWRVRGRHRYSSILEATGKLSLVVTDRV